MPNFFNPSLEDMNKDVLAWNLYNVFTGKAGHKLQKVPIHFTSVDQYLDIFEPLLLEECRAQILRSFQEGSVIEHHLKLQGLQGEAHDPFRTLSFEAPAGVVVSFEPRRMPRCSTMARHAVQRTVVSPKS